MPTETTFRYHDHALSRAERQLEHALGAIGDLDRTLADAGVPAAERGPAAGAQMELFQLQSWIASERRRAAGGIDRLPVAAPVSPVAEQPRPLAPAGTPPAVPAAVRRLFGERAEADLETAYAQVVTVSLVEARGAQILGETPRLALRSGMPLSGRFVDHHGAPWLVSMTCRDAVDDDAVSRVVLDVTSVTPDDQRAERRLGIESDVLLTAVACGALPPGSEVRGEVANLSRSGMAVTVGGAHLQPGDLLRFALRLLEGRLAGEIRIASVRHSADGVVAGCWFTALEPGSADVIRAVLDRTATRAPAAYPALRALLRSERASLEGADT